MRKHIFTVLIFLTLVLVVSGRNDISDEQIRKILEKRIEMVKDPVMPEVGGGIIVGIIEQNKRRIISCGQISDSDKRSLRADTIIEIGSITKTFTCLLLADMANRNLLEISDPVSKFLSKNSDLDRLRNQEMTLLSLATHTSGLPFMPDNILSDNPKDPFKDYNTERMLEFLSSYEPEEPTNHNYSYSNYGMALLGHILELKSRTKYEELLKSRICNPLGMKDTVIDLSSEQKKRFAPGHNRWLKEVSPWEISSFRSVGAIKSTMNDLLTYVEFNLGLVENDLAELAIETHKPRYDRGGLNRTIGLGWNLIEKHGTHAIWHSGLTNGAYAIIVFDRNEKRGVVVLSNFVHSTEDIAFHLMYSENDLKY